MAFTFTDETAMTDATTLEIKKPHFKELVDDLTAIKAAVTIEYTPAITYDDTLKYPTEVLLSTLRASIQGMETAFSNNCNCVTNTECQCACQSCQGEACQACQSCQSCQSYTCQTQSCQICQSCQSYSYSQCALTCQRAQYVNCKSH